MRTSPQTMISWHCLMFLITPVVCIALTKNQLLVLSYQGCCDVGCLVTVPAIITFDISKQNILLKQYDTGKTKYPFLYLAGHQSVTKWRALRDDYPKSPDLSELIDRYGVIGIRSLLWAGAA